MIGPTRQRPCPICKDTTEQTLRPTPTGAAWICSHGAHAAQEYSPDDMRELLTYIAGTLPAPAPKPAVPLEGVRVFIEGVKGEGELDARFLAIHTEITGTLPIVGQPLYQRIEGVPAPFNIVPYGKVLRIECPKQYAS